MMRKIRRSWLFLFLIVFTVSCSQHIYHPATVVLTASSTSPVAPVLKGVPQNPLLRIRIDVPAGTAAEQLRSMHCTLNEAALADLQQLDIYFTGPEPLFNSSNLHHTLLPAAASFQVPLDLTLRPGVQYIWISATLKESANIDHRIELHARQLTLVSGQELRIEEDGSGYNKRMGIAIRKAGDDGVHTYRIPGITATDKGTLIAVYDIRYNNTRDLPENIDVGMSRSTDGGRSWEPMKVIMDMGAPHENNGIGDPAVLFDPVAKKLWVAALWSKGNRSIAGSEPGLSADTTGQFVLVSSDDDGRSWSQPYSITSQVKNPSWHLYFNGPGSGIAMQNGTLVFASQYWDESKKPGMPHAAVVYSTDHGATWKSGTGAKSNTTESQVVETTAGTLMLNMRDNRGGYRSVATSTDMGTTWVEHQTSYRALPDPVCMASLVKLPVKREGRMQDLLFFSNVNSPLARLNMTVKGSLDLGETWLPQHQLLIDERRSFGYSSLTKVDDNTIGLLYEGTRDLYFVRIPVSEIIR
jgi:sialidase-1